MGLSGGQFEEEYNRAREEYLRTKQVPVGWKLVDGRLEKMTNFGDVLDVLEGENSLGRGPLEFLEEDDIANFRLVDRRSVEFTQGYRSDLPAALEFRDIYEGDEDWERADENRESDLEKLLMWLKIHKNPRDICFPHNYATLDVIRRIMIVDGKKRQIPFIDLYGSRQPVNQTEAFSYFKGVEWINIDETIFGDEAIAVVGETLKILHAEESEITDASFPFLRRLEQLYMSTKNTNIAKFSNFAPLRRLRELGISGNLSEAAWLTLPETLEELQAAPNFDNSLFPRVTNQHLTRLPNLKTLTANRCDNLTSFPVNIDRVFFTVCPNLLPTNFYGRTFDLLHFWDMPYIPQCKFVKILHFNEMNLERAYDENGEAVTNFPDCERLFVRNCEIFSFDNLRLCKSLKKLYIRSVDNIVGYRPEEFFEDLRNMCPNLEDLGMDYASLRDIKGKPSDFGFDWTFL